MITREIRRLPRIVKVGIEDLAVCWFLVLDMSCCCGEEGLGRYMVLGEEGSCIVVTCIYVDEKTSTSYD